MRSIPKKHKHENTEYTEIFLENPQRKLRELCGSKVRLWIFTTQPVPRTR